MKVNIKHLVFFICVWPVILPPVNIHFLIKEAELTMAVQ